MITHRRPARQPTKERLLDAGVRLFSENGFRETTVGDIEAAAGLEPRRGAMYRHFPSKEALLEAALARHLETAMQTGTFAAELPSGDARADALAIGRWLLDSLDRERPVLRILEQDGDRLPGLREAYRTLVDGAYAAGRELLRRALGARARRSDVDALVVMLLGALVNFRRSTWTFGASPLGLDEDRFLSAWAENCVTLLAAAPR